MGYTIRFPVFQLLAKYTIGGSHTSSESESSNLNTVKGAKYENSKNQLLNNLDFFL